MLEEQQHVLLELELEARVCLRGKGRALLPARQGVEAFTTYALGCIPRKAITQPATQHDVCRHLNLRSISSCSTMAVLGMQPKAYVVKASTPWRAGSNARPFAAQANPGLKLKLKEDMLLNFQN